MNEKKETVSIEYGKPRMTFRRFILNYNIYIIFLLLCIISVYVSPLFLRFNNVINILRQQCVYITIGMGLLLVMVTGGIDLSVTSTATIGCIMVTHIVVTKNFNTGWGMIFAVLSALAVCSLVGSISGALVALMKMPPFVVTLAMGFGGQGLAYLICNGAALRLDFRNPAAIAFTTFGQRSDPLLGIPYQVYLVAALVIIISLIMKYTSYGRLTLAIGSNENAVTAAGIDIRKYKFIAYTASGFLAGLAGVLIVAGNGSSSPLTSSADFTMVAIAGTVIGGTNLQGGEGSAVKSVFGILVIGIIGNIMNLTNVPPYPQMIVRAVLIILAVFLRSVTSRREA